MATFISLIRFTPQGMDNIRETTIRSQAFRAAAQKVGVTVKQIYWTLGAHDGVVICEAPDDETATVALLRLGSLGNVSVQTMRAFDESEMAAILGKMP